MMHTSNSGLLYNPSMCVCVCARAHVQLGGSREAPGDGGGLHEAVPAFSQQLPLAGPRHPRHLPLRHWQAREGHLPPQAGHHACW